MSNEGPLATLSPMCPPEPELPPFEEDLSALPKWARARVESMEDTRGAFYRAARVGTVGRFAAKSELVARARAWGQAVSADEHLRVLVQRAARTQVPRCLEHLEELSSARFEGRDGTGDLLVLMDLRDLLQSVSWVLGHQDVDLRDMLDGFDREVMHRWSELPECPAELLDLKHALSWLEPWSWWGWVARPVSRSR